MVAADSRTHRHRGILNKLRPSMTMYMKQAITYLIDIMKYVCAIIYYNDKRT